ncbi:TTCA-like protein [Mya arenaria]|uniref:TTCA-like protein n=1 Tax=Mya arenaria TaxID=6604 RepID=A0ABY7DQI7_MYAAR|nr:TTCA-like protein [Mya arenaria]
MTARDRHFYDIPLVQDVGDQNQTSNEKDVLLKYINSNLIGNGKAFSGPFGLRKVLYLDYTASGRSLEFIEDYIRDEVLPEYGNTHTTTTVTSLQTTLYRHEASPYEHHSNLLPWIEVGAKRWSGTGRQMIGCFCAASNVTGVLVDVDPATVLLHKHGALAFWDYATAAPYVKIDLNPVIAGPDQPYLSKDAVFISCHKFVGGVQTPGVLIAKKKLFKNTVPDGCGGGSVFFVRRDGHRYLQEPELKEEGGTPAIVEAVRAGLVFQLKHAKAWQDVPNLVLLGNSEAPRLPIFSFLILHEETGRFLHHNYITALLNDLFGIQARGGCACAGPYAMDILGMDEATSKNFEDLLAEDSRLDRTHLRRYREYSQREIIRPGFVRINFPYFLDEESLNFTLEAVKMVAKHAWKLLPQYMFNPETGEWRQVNFQVFKDRKWLGHISYSSGEMTYKVPPLWLQLISKITPVPLILQDCLKRAEELFMQAAKVKHQLTDHTVMFDEDSKPLRWFLLPSEAASCLQGNQSQNSYTLPFCPPSVREQLGLSPFEEHNSDEEPSEKDMRKNNMLRNVFYTFDEGEVSENVGKVSDRKLAKNEHSDNTKTSKESGNSPSSSSPERSETEKGESGICALKSVDKLNNSQNCDKSEKVDKDSTDICVRKRAGSENVVGNSKRQKDVAENDGAGGNKGKQKKKGGQQWPWKSMACWWMETGFWCVSVEARTPSLSSTPSDSTSSTAGKSNCGFQKMSFDIGAVTVDPQTPSYDPSPLKKYLASLGVPYFYESQYNAWNTLVIKFTNQNTKHRSEYDNGDPYDESIMDQASNLPYECASICSFCSRMKRGIIYACARREGYNVLALGQHLDDLCEREGDLRVIRPLVYVREKDLREFAETNKLPVIAENCPACFEAPKERHRIKQLLASQEIMFPRIFPSLNAAIKPIMAINRTQLKLADILQAADGDGDDMDI